LSHPRTIQSELPGALEEEFREALAELQGRRAIERLRERDPGLWKDDPGHAAVIRNRLGWLDAPPWLESRLPELHSFADEVRQNGFTRVLLLGMGGSSLAPEVLQSVCTAGPGSPTLEVLDSTVPAAIQALEGASRLDRTFFLVSSKSGKTIETMSQYRYFRDRLSSSGIESSGRQFAAITDAGSPLERVAEAEEFRHVFRNPPDVGGRYSALTYFGMVPAALLGLDLIGLAERARVARTESLSPSPSENGALRLAALLGAAARRGRDKLTLVLSPRLRAFGYWIEQLVAESTGKEGTGVIPVEGEPLGPIHHYGGDRILVTISLRGAPDPDLAHLESEWSRSGAPLATIELPDRDAVAGEFVRWEVATALLGALLEIDPFDEPNVQESKDATGRVLSTLEQTGAFPREEARARDEEVEIYAPESVWGKIQAGAPSMPSLERILSRFLSLATEGDYVAILAFLDRSASAEASFALFRRAIRNALHLPVLQGYGPRYLHSIGQLYKGGPKRGLFLVLTAPDRTDLAIPGQHYSFSQLKTAQALGDFEALDAHSKPVLRLHLLRGAEAGLSSLAQAAERALTSLQNA
jgi:glucose-6-phosphate isomerase